MATLGFGAQPTAPRWLLANSHLYGQPSRRSSRSDTLPWSSPSKLQACDHIESFGFGLVRRF
jgi:hypothetical protein